MLNVSSSSLDAVLQSAARHRAAGQVERARSLCGEILSLHPHHAGALHLLGVIAKESGELDASIEFFRRSVALNPHSPEIFCNLALALNQKGLFDQAIEACDCALRLQPDYPEALYNLGNAHHQKGFFGEAIAAYRRAIALKPDHLLALFNLGTALQKSSHSDEAVAAYQEVLRLNANFAPARNNLGNIFRSRRRFDEAIACYRGAIGSQPDYAEAHHNLAFTLLLLGDIQNGFREFEWRKRFPHLVRHFDSPPWDGSPLRGRTLLLHVEQGFGDTILFARFARVIMEQSGGGKIVVACQPALFRLLRNNVPGIDLCVTDGIAVPHHDVHALFMSLPFLLGITRETIPRDVPYLQPYPQDVARWKERLANDAGRFKVGLAWTGNPSNSHNADRSLPLSALAPLGGVRDVSFYMLQKGAGAEQALSAPAGLSLVDFTNELEDFAETAAFIANLDLVIAIDSAVAHLAGAMGKRVWTPLAFVPDWRYGLEGEESRWFPTMRLFRQPAAGDWEVVASQLRNALIQQVRAR